MIYVFLNKKWSYMSAALLLAFSATSYATPTGSVATATANLVFAQPGVASVSITPETNLKAGDNEMNTKFAQFTVTNSDVSGSVAYRWTPASGTPGSVPEALNVESANGHFLHVKLATNGTTYYGDGSGGPGWFVPTTPVNTLTRDVVSTNTQDVIPDTYPISIDATVWLN